MPELRSQRFRFGLDLTGAGPLIPEPIPRASSAMTVEPTTEPSAGAEPDAST